MSKNYILVDGNSLGHFHNNSKPLKVGEIYTHATVGFIQGLRTQLAMYPNFTPIVLWDGVPWRKLKFPDYKENRQKTETKNEIRMMEMKQIYKTQLPHIKKALALLGVAQLEAFNMEADDLAAILADRYSPNGMVILMTADRDWLQLVGKNVVWRDFLNNKTVGLNNFQEATGCETTAQFVEAKALSGDAGDNIPGVGGIGEKGAVDFLKQYKSFANFTSGVILDKTIDIKKLPKKFRNLVEDEERAIIFSRNIDLMDLRTKKRPAPQGLQLNKGTPDSQKFHRFCELLLFQKILNDFDNWISAFPHFKQPLAA